MSSSVSLGGSSQLIAGPQLACVDGIPFPGGIDTIPLQLTPSDKPYGVSTGRQTPNLNSPSAATPLAMGAVTNATLLYLRAPGGVLVSISYLSLTAPVQPQPVLGTLLLEANPTNPITSVSVQGVGQIEWEAWGPQ